MTRVLPYVPAEAEAEVSAAYDRTVKARVQGEEAVVLVVSAWSSSVTRRCRGGGGGEAAGASGVGAENDRLGSRLGRLAKTSVSPAPAPPAGQS